MRTSIGAGLLAAAAAVFGERAGMSDWQVFVTFVSVGVGIVLLVSRPKAH